MIKKVAKWKGRIPFGKFPICFLCGKPITSVEELSQDHLTPVSKGGHTVPSNIVVAHKRCNCKKGDRTYEEWLIYQERNRQR